MFKPVRCRPSVQSGGTVTDMFQRIGEELSNDQLLRVYLLLTQGIWYFHREILIWAGASRESSECWRDRTLFTEWASPSVLLIKRDRDGSVRWCIELRKLNDVTVKDCYPLPLLQDCMDAQEGCQYFTNLDMASGYY